MILIEKDLEFDFSNAITATLFDDTAVHGNSSMKRVDFIAEHNDCYVFIEVKDPDIPDATAEDKFNFLQNLSSGKLVNSFAGKYRDSLLFRQLEGKNNKPVDYIVLLSMSSLDPAMLLNKIDILHREIPIIHNSWSNSSARSCVILNLEQYKTRFGETSVRRISEGTE
ncbi:hypothetical protein GPUN_2333 [Glaciecola punicea ACAM 611]|uniref:Uncharacterized protein n=1 Tax=Glaciecola punicea ACAM 611 TaxID=1121923 RepID=H5TDS1_9ALTE|nr:hypothetical protein [Glaciecola punicea]GAB56448.1 hypothetical protein GPUN_2333 [Glaciecola punicea ACAM 611]